MESAVALLAYVFSLQLWESLSREIGRDLLDKRLSQSSETNPDRNPRIISNQR